MVTRTSKNDKGLLEKSKAKNYILPQQLSMIGKGRGHGVELRRCMPNFVATCNNGISESSNNHLSFSNSGASHLSSQQGITQPHSMPPNESNPSPRNAPSPSIDNDFMPPEEDPLQQEGYTATEMMASHSINEISTSNATEKAVRRRGSNKCKKVARLRDGNKIEITFYQGCPVGKNHKVWSRHLGRIVHDRNICPVKVHSWNDVTERQKEHMWAAVTDKFTNNKMEDYKSHTLKHLKELWVKWRAAIYHKIKGLDMQQQLQRKPMAIEVESDWQWLVMEHFHSDKFMALSKRNTANKEGLNKKLLHRTGSMPLREISWQKGGKDGKPPDFGTMYFESHKKGNTLATTEASQVHETIINIQQAEPSLLPVEVVEKVYGESRTRKYIAGYGGGVTPRDVRGPYKTKNAMLDELKSKDQALKEKEEALKIQEQTLQAVNDEKRATQKRLRKVENMLDAIVNNQNFQQLLQFSEDDDGSTSFASMSEDDNLN